ncbi:MAG TPA: TetR/AcrR family transcriptional regulator [Jatrophihabitantaceae bacterium]|nr:TetR/AcrR family transcriptional regulator [Jatrophihabitantaceae bacterium]
MSAPATTSAHRRRRAQRGSGEQLRAEIIAAAKELLAHAARADDVSIRAVADAVGITSPSIYLHFEDKNALFAAVVADVFEELDKAMLTAADGLTDPLERLRAFGFAYVKFALGHAEHYRIAALDPCPIPEVDRVVASGAFVHFNQTVVECIGAGIFRGDDPLPITLQLWSAAHGIAALMITKPFLPWGDPDDMIDRVLCSAALGRAASDLIGDNPQPAQLTAWLAAQRAAKAD